MASICAITRCKVAPLSKSNVNPRKTSSKNVTITDASPKYLHVAVNRSKTLLNCNNYASINNGWKKSHQLPYIARAFASGSEKKIPVPNMGDSITDGEIQKWHKAVGEKVDVDELVCSIETDKVVVEIRAPVAGVIKKLFADVGKKVKVGEDLFVIDTEGVASTPAKPKEASKPEAPQAAQAPQAPQAPQPRQAPTPPPVPPQAPPTPSPPPPSSPKAEEAKPKPSTPTPTPSTFKPTGQRTETRVKMTRLRSRVAERLKGSQNTYAMLTTFQECDMTNLMALRADFKDDFEKKHGVKLGFMSGFVKAAVKALQEQPVVNAVIDGEEIVYKDYIDISVAVATPTGLVVPVLRNCDQMSFADIEKGINELGQKARKGQITIEDMTGGTFTISNGGVYGSMMGTPIINPPQSAILGMHAITKRAVVINDKIEIRPMMYLALTYDHRLIDGKEAVTFLRTIKHGVEDPRRLLLDL